MVNYTMLFSLRLFYFWSLFSHYYNLELQYNKVHSCGLTVDNQFVKSKTPKLENKMLMKPGNKPNAKAYQ